MSVALAPLSKNVERLAPRASLQAWCDGSGTTAEKHAAVGVVIVAGDVALAEASEAIGLGTNNDAELRAIKRALYLAWSIGGTRNVALTVYSDSAWALGAVQPSCEWHIRRPEQARLCERMREEIRRWPLLTFAHVRGHTGLVWNERADALAGRARKLAAERAGEGLR